MEVEIYSFVSKFLLSCSGHENRATAINKLTLTTNLTAMQNTFLEEKLWQISVEWFQKEVAPRPKPL
jgi:hypothetical protein